MKTIFFIILVGFLIVIFLCYGLERTLFLPIILTPLSVWLLSCYYDGQNSKYTMDILTVYLFVWQFIYLMCVYRNCELSWPFITLRHISLCILYSIKVFLFYHLAFRYLSTQLQFAFLWLLSLYDV